MDIDRESRTAEFRIRFAAWSPAEEPIMRCPYVGTFRIQGTLAMVRGIPARFFRTTITLGAVLGSLTMIGLSLLLANRPDGLWKSVLAGLLVVFLCCGGGWLISRLRRVRLPIALAEAKLDVSDLLDKPYARISRPDGHYLLLVPDYHYEWEFQHLLAGLVELLTEDVKPGKS